VIEDGNAIVRTRGSFRDPPPVTFREGKTIDHLDTTKPQAYKPSKPVPATINIQFTPTIIHPWYMVPIRQCLVCRTIYQSNLISISDNFDLCNACVEKWKYYQKDSTKTNWTNMREPTRTLIYPTLDLKGIVESYDIPELILFFLVKERKAETRRQTPLVSNMLTHPSSGVHSQFGTNG
jgi:hypothetical protein